MPISKNEFIKWLKDEDSRPLLFRTSEKNYAFFKVPKNEHFDYLYSQFNYGNSNIERNISFAYSGIYCRQDGMIYDSYGRFRNFAEGVECHVSRDQMQKELENMVRLKVEAIIADNRANLRVSLLSTDEKITDYNYFAQHIAAEKARELFIQGANITDIRFRCGYEFDGWNEENYLQYLLDRDGFAQQQTDKHIDEHQEDMFSQFLENYAVRQELQNIINNPGSTLHLIKAIL